MEPDYWILDDRTYFNLVDNYTARLNDALKKRYNAGLVTKGRVDLSARDFNQEAWEERVDEVAYTLMEEERVRKAKGLL